MADEERAHARALRNVAAIRTHLQTEERRPRTEERKSLESLHVALDGAKKPKCRQDEVTRAALHAMMKRACGEVHRKFGEVQCIEVQCVKRHTINEYVVKANFEAYLKQGHWPRYLAFVITKEVAPDSSAPPRQIMVGLLAGDGGRMVPQWRTFAYLEGEEWHAMAHTALQNTGASDPYPDQGAEPGGHPREENRRALRSTLIQANESDLTDMASLKRILFASLLSCIHQQGDESLLVWPDQGNGIGVDFDSPWGPLTAVSRAQHHAVLPANERQEMRKRDAELEELGKARRLQAKILRDAGHEEATKRRRSE